MTLTSLCLLLGAAVLSDCGPAGAPATSGSSPGAVRPVDATAGREIVLRSGAASVISLTYDERVFFDTDQDRPRPEAAPVLAALAARLKRARPPPHMAVLGHTDARGTDAYNLALSRRRARNVVAALARRGVDPRLLEAVAVGRRQPVASDDSEAGRARNRRVEFLISPSARAIETVLAARPAVLRLRETHPSALAVQRRPLDPLGRAPLGAPVPY